MIRVAIALVIAFAHHSHAEGLRRVGSCLVDPAAVAAVVDVRVLSIDQPTYRCSSSSEGIDPGFLEPLRGDGTGCIVVKNSPHCMVSLRGEAPAEVDVTVDGTARRATFTAGIWQACGLASGPHELATCTLRGDLRCRAEAIANQHTFVDVIATEPKLRVRVETSHLGTYRRGRELDVILHTRDPIDRVELPARVALTWPTAESPPRARLCSQRPPQPGCTRCTADAVDGGTFALAGIVAGLLARARRKR